MPVDPIKLADLVRTLRIHRGLSQRELADSSGIGNQTISRLERGLAHAFRPVNAQRLLDALSLARPLTDAEVANYKRLSGLTDHEITFEVPPSPLAAEAAEIDNLVKRLKEALGANHLLKELETLRDKHTLTNFVTIDAGTEMYMGLRAQRKEHYPVGESKPPSEKADPDSFRRKSS